MLSIRLQGPSCEFKIINIKNKDNVYYIECKPHKNCRNSYLHDESLYNFPDIKPAGLKPCVPVYNKPVPNDTALLSILSSPLSVVTVNKRYRASDNLRLRSSGSTAGKPVVTIGKGAQVKLHDKNTVLRLLFDNRFFEYCTEHENLLYSY